MGSVVNTRQLSRCTKSFSFLLSLAALCCVRRWQGSPSCFLSARAPPPPPCRLLPSPPPPPSQPPLQCQAHSAHRTAQTYVDRFESKNLEYFPPCSNCLTDMFLLPFISIQVLTLNSTNMCKQNIETGSFK